WLAGGHNGLSNSEDPNFPEPPLPRVKELREVINSFGLQSTPIIMAGGVWYLREWEEWIDNPELGKIAFQFGSRPLLTQESPISDAWKKKLLNLKEGDIYLNRFSPTGFYSSAVKNAFLQNLTDRSARQIAYQAHKVADHDTPLPIGPRQRIVYVTKTDFESAQRWIKEGYVEALRTPDATLVFETPERAQEVHLDQVNCMGCLSACTFSNWSQDERGMTGKKADPRSFCIQKTLQAISHSSEVDNQLMFAGHGAYRFAEDPFYANGFIPTVKQLVERLKTGD
ncbi:MAG: nitronate monooxygenase, partial [Alphaproteobacteria bacterium]|nr:nitronate monooxygenase [Alphaproteobacteria bacterium]